MLRGHLTAFFMFDVADAIDLAVVRGLIDATVATPLSTRPATPTYLQYQQPPLTFDGAALGLSEVEGFRTRGEGVRLWRAVDCLDPGAAGVVGERPGCGLRMPGEPAAA